MPKKNIEKSKKTSKPVARTATRHTAHAKARTIQAATKSVKVTSPVSAPAVATITPDIATRIIETASRLQDPIAENTIQAINELALTGDLRAAQPLVDVLENRNGFYHVVTRAAAAMALGQLGQPSAISALLQAANDSMAEVSCESILALGELRARQAVDALINIVNNFDGYYLNVTRHAAIRALGQIGDIAAKPVLENVINSTWENHAIQSAAQEAAALL